MSTIFGDKEVWIAEEEREMGQIGWIMAAKRLRVRPQLICISGLVRGESSRKYRSIREVAEDSWDFRIQGAHGID